MTTTIQNYKPILFSTVMVQANSAGRKTKTRRIVDDKHTGFLEYAFKQKKNLAYWVFTNAKYRMGDILWVRETFSSTDCDIFGIKYSYKADFRPGMLKFFNFKPSIHMPKEAARQFLNVFSVRVERLQDITENDSIAEGVLLDPDFGYHCYQCEKGHVGGENICEDGFFKTAKDSFKSLWQSINGKKIPWNENPFVWVYEYEKIEKPKERPL